MDLAYYGWTSMSSVDTKTFPCSATSSTMLIGYGVGGVSYTTYLELDGNPHSLPGHFYITTATRTVNSVTIEHSSPADTVYGVRFLVVMS